MYIFKKIKSYVAKFSLVCLYLLLRALVAIY